ncbi:MAG: DUF3854 domain-containing protein [Pegethrix bostrychoides GSE-TBD4-15B]|jgi:TusA-related sulfurtransferase|uniref:DUF3854 domain-containing protein n=1 Tax=Pegethrix bostrychoides GSE-TBD4-15B TaxID=2839662 RepID=A0A951P7R1_9CYAN|nr:DUF3854 domain-containing protein [Pegethrix bostrychoides GSE-TBD4-15B]
MQALSRSNASLALASSALADSEKITIGADFYEQIHREYTADSAIALELFEATVQLTPDLILLPGGEVETPIHNTLNWSYSRFTQQAKRGELWAALLLNEDGSTWQAKLSSPRLDQSKTLRALQQRLEQPVLKSQLKDLLKQYPDATIYQKYETAVGNGSRAYLPHVPPEIRQRIAERYQVDVPLSGSFWSWLANHPEIPILFTEGGKKALSLLSLGYIAIALYGVNGGYRSKDDLGYPVKPHLAADVERFAAGRSVLLAFDQDVKTSTRHSVALAVRRFSYLLMQAGSEVSIVQWQPKQGKGVDDLIVAQGEAAWHQAYSDAMPFEHWQIAQRLENRLTYPATLKLTTADLSTIAVEQLPESGIIGLTSAKGTGKTKFIAKTVIDSDKVLSAGHRVSLMRNLSHRLGLDYRGDLDKVKGQFINGAGYSLRVGFCVDALLAIDPERFAGCDLVLDELVQVLRHLLTSSTCAKDGKRPALLTRFQQIVQVSRRVIVADADLDNVSLHYLQTLRPEDSGLFLIRNDYQPAGYPVRFIDAPDRGGITLELLQAVDHLPSGQVLYIATDSKAFSKTIARMIGQQNPESRVLVINSETSGGDCETEFMQQPDVVLAVGEYDVIIASPSVATGVSIEAQGIISKVYGIFTGASSTDADLAQALGRVREPVERVVWCSTVGNNFSKVSRSANPIELKRYLLDKTSTTISLIRSGLKADVAGAVTNCDWQADPHINLYSRISADQNFAMQHLRTALLVRLKHEGNQVKLEAQEADPVMRLLLADVRNEIKQQDAETLVKAEILSYLDVALLEQKELLSLDEQRALARYYLCDFYCLEPQLLTPEFVLWDREGKRRSDVLSLEAQMQWGIALERDIKALERQLYWGQGHCTWDFSHAELRRTLRQKLGLEKFLDPELEWTEYDLEAEAKGARELATPVQAGLNFTIPSGERENGRPKMSDVQIVHQLLSQFGIKVAFRWSRLVAGHEGEKLRVYRLDEEHWQTMTSILERRQGKRVGLEQKAAAEAGSSPQLDSQIQQGDPAMGGDGSASEGLERMDSAVLAMSTDLLSLGDSQPETDVLECSESLTPLLSQEADSDEPNATDC